MIPVLSDFSKLSFLFFVVNLAQDLSILILKKKKTFGFVDFLYSLVILFSIPFIATLIFTFCLLLALAQFALHFSSSFKVFGGFPGGSDGKGSACNVGDLGSILG